MTIDERAICGAGNNADWYEAVFAIHGLKYDRRPYAFVGQDNAPPYHSDLTVLAPDKTALIRSELANLAKRFDGMVGLKDSFSQLDLEQNGFETLFEASWIWRQSNQVDFPKGWGIVGDFNQLTAWEHGWKQNGSPTDHRMFPQAFLDRSDVFFLGHETDGRFAAGCIANLSTDCVGLSNVFAEDHCENRFSEAADAVANIGGNLPVVGYESGPELEYANRAGFQSVGDLRILVAKSATF